MGQPTETIRTTALATTVSAATADAARRCIDRHGNAVAVPVFEWVARRLVAIDARITSEVDA